MKKTVVAFMLFASIGVGLPAYAAEPSLHEVYQAANSGRMNDAQRMMKEVLQLHPNSGKAHYVEAELLAKQGNLTAAANELATAEKLAPGLPFATAQSVSSLREVIANQPASKPVRPQGQPASLAAPAAYSESRFPWGMLLTGLGLIAFIVWAARYMNSRSSAGRSGLSPSGYGGYPQANPSGPGGVVPQGYGAPVGAPAAEPGLGSRVMGGLATGVAVGAGVAAGEALVHHFMDGRRNSSMTSDQAFSGIDSIPDLPSTPLNDMGGNDFGVSDASSWDDGGSGDSEWN